VFACRYELEGQPEREVISEKKEEFEGKDSLVKQYRCSGRSQGCSEHSYEYHVFQCSFLSTSDPSKELCPSSK